MRNRSSTHTTRAIMTLALAATLLVPAQAMAQPGGPQHGHDHHPQPRHQPSPHRYDALPGNCVAIMVDGIRFFYGLGVFYQHGPHGYTVVDAPMGAVIPRLPPGCAPVLVAGTTYYTTGGIYYLPSPPGYVVVPAPMVVQPAPVVVQPTTPQSDATPSPTAPSDSVTVVIVNPNGSRTPVTLKRVPDGWQGTKGEIYPTLPDESQLAPYYGLTAPGETI